MLRKTTALLSLLLTSAVLSSCGDDPATSPAPVTDEASFSLLQKRILTPTCAISGCHVTGASMAIESNLVLEPAIAYQSLVGVAPTNVNARADGLLRVKPFSSDSSLLYHKLHWDNDHHGKDYGAVMPLGGRELSIGQMEFVRRWIDAGAPMTGVVADASLLDDTTRPSTAPFTPLAAPAFGTGIQLALEQFSIQPNFEREFFQYRKLNNPAPMYVTGVEVKMRPGSHHFVLYTFAQGTPAYIIPQDNVVRDIRNPDGSTNNANTQAMGYHVYFAGSTQPDFRYQFPEGVALKVPANAALDLNSHYVNKTDAPTSGEVYANLYTTDSARVRFVAETLNLGETSFRLPPGQRTTVRRTFKTPVPINVFMLTSHSHALGETYLIRITGGTRDGEIVYRSTTWEHPTVTTYSPPIYLKAGEGLTSEVTYNNTTAREVRFGLTSEDEMDIIFGYYYR